MKNIISLLLLYGLCAEMGASSFHVQEAGRNQTYKMADQLLSLQAPGRPMEQQQDQVAMDNITHKTSNFGFDLYRQIANNHDDNVFFSPLCVSFALASLLLGTKGATEAEILQSLALQSLQDDEHPNRVPAFFKRIKDHLKENDELVLDQGNFAFIHEEFPVKESFLNMTRKYFDMEVTNLDFHNSTTAKDIINQYIRKLTAGKIPQLYDSLDPQTKCVLISYILFKGKWLYPFNEAFTELQPFHINKYSTVKVPMMYKTDKVSSTFDKKFGCSVVKLPYRGNAAMLVILPEGGRDFFSIEDNLTSELVETWLATMKSRKMDIFFPKFKLDHKYEMDKLLQELGIRDVFSGSANFTGLTDQRNMRLSQVTQRAVIEVDEKGTEASAATGSEIVGYSMPPTVRVDHPFLFLIVEETSRSILFVGRVVNPKEQ